MAVMKELKEKKSSLHDLTILKIEKVQTPVKTQTVSVISKPDCCNFKNPFGTEGTSGLTQISTPHETLYKNIINSIKDLA